MARALVQARTRWHWWLALLPLLWACAELPSGEELERWNERDAPARQHARPDDATLRAALGRLDADDLAFVQQVAQIESSVALRPLLGGNRVRLLQDGPATHAAQLDAIRKARSHIHLDIYLLTDDEVGQRYLEALSGRAQAGVQVRLIVDGLGGQGAGAPFRERLAEAGVELREFNSVNPLKDLRVWRVSRRSHRKILVVDGRTAFTGGINITDDYAAPSRGSATRGSGSASGSSSASASGSSSGRKLPRGWRDTHVQIEGPVVAEFQRLFLAYWDALGDPAPADDGFYPPLPPRGHQVVRVVTDQGDDLLGQLASPAAGLLRRLGRDDEPESRIYVSYLAAMHHARKRIWITQSYFAPNDAFIEVLEQAARRGVDVRLLMPSESDVPLLRYAAQHYYQRLLDAGIRLYEYQDTMLHAKTAVVDGVWSTVGSANLDYRSFIHNDEANAIVIGREFADDMQRMYEADLRNAREIDAAQWKQRPWRSRLKERGAAAIKFLL